MYRIGYIDDQPFQYENYKKKLKRRYGDIELVLLDGCATREEFLQKIYEERIDVLLVDYKMAGTFGFNGSTLINYINDQIRDLDCYILTAVEQESVDDGLVANRNIQSKTVFDTEGDDEERVENLNRFVQNLKDSANVFKKRRELKREQYLELFNKKKQDELSLSEEEEYLRLYKVLASYGMIEKLPEKMLNSEFEQDLDKLLEAGKIILERHNNGEM